MGVLMFFQAHTIAFGAGKKILAMEAKVKNDAAEVEECRSKLKELEECRSKLKELTKKNKNLEKELQSKEDAIAARDKKLDS